MTRTAQAIRLPASATFPRIFDANKLLVGGIYLAAYAALDWISFIKPTFGITPWNPGTGLSFVLPLLFGRRMIPFLFVGPLLSELINQQISPSWIVQMLAALLVGTSYSAATLVLMRPWLGFDAKLTSMRDVVLLIAVAVASAAVVATGYVALILVAGALPAADVPATTLRYWVGDVIGVVVMTPFLLFALTRPRILPLSLETAAQFAAIVAALALVFGFVEEQQFQLFYVLFLPVVWMAVRTGTEGVSVGILVTQVGLIVGVQLYPDQARDITVYQALMLVLAMTGLVAGELVTERRRTESQLRLQQEQLARLARLGTMSELSVAVAHEINQPLMAAGTYTRLVDEAIRSGDGGATQVAENARKAAAQVERAAEVVRRLRALVRLDRSDRAPYRLERIVSEVVALSQPDLDQNLVGMRTHVPAELPPVMVDMLQVEQVLLNLLRNSIEAIKAARIPRGSISIEAVAVSSRFVEVRVTDTGPGFQPEVAKTGFLALSSEKAEGLGIGLRLCRTIVENHGGTLTLDGTSKGASIRFTLPIAKTSAHD